MERLKDGRQRVLIGVTIALVLVVMPVVAFGQGATTRRPIQEFVAAQGTFCLNAPSCDLFRPPVPNYIGWTGREPGTPASAPYNRFALVDYAGVANAWLVSVGHASLGTQTSGSVTERVLADGRAEVRVNLFATKALTFVETPTDTPPGTALFGYSATEVRDGATAALGDSFLQLVFINPAPGYPLPDFVQIAFAPVANQQLTFIGFRTSATGALRSGFGVPTGTPGRATITQTGLLMLPRFQGANADGFPVEQIVLRAVGQ